MRALQIGTIGMAHNFFWALALGEEGMAFFIGASVVFSAIFTGIFMGMNNAEV